MPTDPRRLMNSAASAVETVMQQAAMPTVTTKRFTGWRIAAASGFQHLDCAFLVVGLLRDRIGGVERHLVDEPSLVEPGHEHQPPGRLVAPAGLQAHPDFAATGDHPHVVAAPQ